MADHHHHHHHGMADTTESTTVFSTLPQTTASTILQTVMSTVMAASDPHQHVGHHMSSDQAASDFAHSATSDVHSNHVASMDHASHAESMDHPMQMYFYFGVDAVILFKEWTTSSTTGILFSVIGIIIMAMLYEGIKFFREYLFKKYYTSLEYSSVSVIGEDGRPATEVHKIARNRMFSWPHIMQSLLQVIQLVLSYFLMLIFMTFNVWLCLGVVLGSGLGYFLFGWRKATVVDITEHCH